MLRTLSVVALAAALSTPAVAQNNSLVSPAAGNIDVVPLAEDLDHPWGMAVLPNGDLLFSERSGALRVLRLSGDSSVSKPLAGVPAVYARGQGGLLDVALSPAFADDGLVYLSYAEGDTEGLAGTALGRGRLVIGEAPEGQSDKYAGDYRLEGFAKVFTQEPKVSGPNHFGSRIVFHPDGTLLFTLAERFKFDPAQDLGSHLGKVVRINPDGSVPADNPFVDTAGARPEVYSYGHRNIQAAALEPGTDRLWVAEFGPLGGDELNLVEAGVNYGWPLVSWGDDYDGTPRARPDTRPDLRDAATWWTPTISPSGMAFYTGELFPAWRGSAMIGGLTASGIVRVVVRPDGSAEEVERLPLMARVRDVEQGPGGEVYVLTDADDGKVLVLRPLE